MACSILGISLFTSFAEADFFGKAIYLSLFSLSVISWVVMIYKMKLTKKLKEESFVFEKIYKKGRKNILNIEIKDTCSEGNVYFDIYKSVKSKTVEILNKNKFFAEKEKSVDVYLSRSDVDLIESEISAKISKGKKQLEKNLFMLSTIVTLAPFMGLLGTVWGILITFNNLQVTGFAASNSAILSGLAMALGTTVFGLIVAIPALVGYNYLKSNIKEFHGDMENFSHDLMTTLELQYRRVENK